MVRRAALSTALILVAGVLTALAPSAAPAAPSASNAAAQGGSGAEPDPGFGRAQRAAAMAEARRDAPALAKSLGLGKAESLAARSVERDADGTEHVRYDRTLDGIPVIGGDLVVHEKASGAMAGVDYAASGPISAVRTDRPPVGAKAATAVAGRGQGLAQGSVGGAERVIWAVSGQPRLAWQVHVRGVDRQGAPVKRVEYVDAVSGDHIAGWSELEYATATGSGKSLYSGKVSLTTVKKGKGNKRKFLLKDPKRGNSTTVDVQNKEDGTRFLAGKLFTDKDNKWGNGKASNRQSAAVDVAFGAAKTWDYYKSAFSRKGIRGNNKGAKSRVHYGRNFDNAFWDDGCFCMTYGDGGDLFRPLVALDVAGHEMTHGITSNTAGLIYFGESGGLNEATSDIFGTMVEFYANRSADPGDYYIGEKIAKVSGLGTPFLRRMDEPRRRRRQLRLLDHQHGRRRRAPLVRAGEQVLLHALRGHRAQDHRRPGARREPLHRPRAHRHRPRQRVEDLVARADPVHDVDDELHRRPRRDHPRGTGPERRPVRGRRGGLERRRRSRGLLDLRRRPARRGRQRPRRQPGLRVRRRELDVQRQRRGHERPRLLSSRTAAPGGRSSTDSGTANTRHGHPAGDRAGHRDRDAAIPPASSSPTRRSPRRSTPSTSPSTAPQSARPGTSTTGRRTTPTSGTTCR